MYDSIPVLYLWPVVFLFGLAVGSFLNVVILRYEKGQWPRGRSQCMHCKKLLSWRELVPVLSYLLQRGRCIACRAHLTPQYPIVELGTGILFVLVTWSVLAPDGLFLLATSVFIPAVLAMLVLHLAVWSLFIVITVYDLRTKLIPDTFSYTLAAVALCSMFVGAHGLVLPGLWDVLAGPLFLLPFYLLWTVSDGRWIGLGDGKLSLSIGWFLGLSGGGTALLFAFWIGAVVSLTLIGIQKLRKPALFRLPFTNKPLTLKSEVPFGPFLVLGTLVVYLTGADLFALFVL